MIMWGRILVALVVTLLVMACLEYFGSGTLLGGRSSGEMQHDAQSRVRELFWFVIFALVMATALLAALRRWAGHLRRAVVRRTPSRPRGA
jgi:ABC-type dipeptide/oligopeptide/nickel transport system permease subunit